MPLFPFQNKKMLCKISLTFVYPMLLLSLIPPIQSQDSSQDYINAHNAARAEVGVGPLTWDSALAAYPEKFANDSAKTCDLVHSDGPYGENLAWSSGDLLGTDAVRLWVDEKVDYNYTSNTCAAGKVCGHYTQIIWQKTHYLGCAKVRCDSGGSFVSCNYYPPGNIVGQRPYENNQSASAPSPSSLIPPISYPPEVAATPNSPSVPPEGPSQHRRMKIRRLMIGLIVGACVIIVVLSFIWIILRWKKKLSKNDHVLDVSFGDEFEDGMGPKKFSYYELASATNNFGEEQKLGEGGSGAVYKGFLKNLNTFVAVKKISKHSKQGSREYTTEVKIISRLRHRNTVKLIGWCHERELILVYEFMPNGSLDSHLFKGKSLLTWMVRYKIAQDVALALLYLHEEGDHCVLHRDIKSSNIMLDSNFNAKLGDFGLARLVDHAKGSQTTGWAGTMGYMAPECLTAVSKASKESDVYSFGVVAMEIACGRRSIEHQCAEDQVSLVPWVLELYGNKRLLDTVDKRLFMNFDMKQMECLIIVGLWCAHPIRNLRPSIRQVIQVLNFELPLPNLPAKMPVPKYDMPIVQPVSSDNQPSQSLTILR